MRQLWGVTVSSQAASTAASTEVCISSLLDSGSSNLSSALVADVEGVKSVASFGGAGYKLRTNIGLSRAFVRLALEKKRLSVYLKLLISDAALLRELYSRHAFLRCEEEREQFLVHLLALDAVDYYSFTRMLQKAELTYQVALICGNKGRNTSTANLWLCLRGHLGSSGVVQVPRSSPTFVKFNVSAKTPWRAF